MVELAAVFDAKASAWQDYNASAAGRLRHEIVLQHLLDSLGDARNAKKLHTGKFLDYAASR